MLDELKQIINKCARIDIQQTTHNETEAWNFLGYDIAGNCILHFVHLPVRLATGFWKALSLYLNSNLDLYLDNLFLEELNLYT